MKRRRVLLAIAGLGSVVTLLGLAGLIAPFTDRATTGANSIESGARAREVDLQLASDLGGGQCSLFSDDLTTGLISASNVQPATVGSGARACLRNAGSSTASVTFTALDVSDVDTACTGDEAVIDTSCGNGGAGELSSQLSVGFEPINCNDGQPQAVFAESRLDLLATTSSPLLRSDGSAVALAPGEVACFEARWVYFPATTDDATVSQTDLATWRFVFDGTTS
jgi:hypothetical protein